MTITVTANGNVLCIDGIAVLAAKKIISAKYYGGQCNVAAVYEKNDKISIVFISETSVRGTLPKQHIELDPQPKWDRYVVLEISSTDRPFAHYNIEGGDMCIVVQGSIVGPFSQQEGERLLERLRKAL